MAWYYVKAGERKGPIEQEELERYVENGEVLSSTLVWQDGMTYWKSYGELVGGVGDLAEICTLCGQPCKVEDILRFEKHWVCPGCKGEFVQRLKEGSLPATGTQYGGFWLRFVAYTIDTMVVIIPMAIVGLLFSMMLLPLMANDNPAGFFLFYIMLLGLQHGVPAIYEIIMIKQYGATLGKMVFNLEVVDGNGRRLSWGRSIGRHFAKYLNQFTCTLSLVIVAFDSEKRAVQDHLCNTRVIKT